MSEIKSNRAWREECESLRQQLAAALAACKLKDEALQHYAGLAGDDAFNNYLAIHALNNKPDDSALRAWLGEPVGWCGTSGVGEFIVSKSKVWNFLTTPLYRAWELSK